MTLGCRCRLGHGALSLQPEPLTFFLLCPPGLAGQRQGHFLPDDTVASAPPTASDRLSVWPRAQPGPSRHSARRRLGRRLSHEPRAAPLLGSEPADAAERDSWDKVSAATRPGGHPRPPPRRLPRPLGSPGPQPAGRLTTDGTVTLCIPEGDPMGQVTDKGSGGVGTEEGINSDHPFRWLSVSCPFTVRRAWR